MDSTGRAGGLVWTNYTTVQSCVDNCGNTIIGTKTSTNSGSNSTTTATTNNANTTNVIPANIVTRIDGVTCGSNGCGVTRGTMIHGGYVFSQNASNLTCKVWYSQNAAHSLGDEARFGANQDSSKISDSFDINTATIAADATSFIIQPNCSGLVNGVYTTAQDTKVVTLLVGATSASDTNPVVVSINYVAEITAMFAGNSYTKLYHPVPTQEHINNWTNEINERGLVGAKAFFPVSIKAYACSADPARYYLANNPDVKAYFDAHPSENVDNSGARKHWDSSGKNEQRVSCW